MARADWHHLYNRAAWKALRKAQLSKEPLCVMCLQDSGRPMPATVVDHKQKHEGNEALFFDPNNLQSLCKPHHDASKQREEKRGAVIGCDVNGMPLDPKHHWR